MLGNFHHKKEVASNLKFEFEPHGPLDAETMRSQEPSEPVQ